ncbi:vWA domain-containing protein [Pedobacter frigoris]|uniref:vWA domain-containing protein n=1 Tax=Pedobacter frigoris TaxID=2571272 RepID=UPI00292F12F6|nr:carboxypeptidase-like regulatory domain-containing protein [Pedobacter frigoris]
MKKLLLPTIIILLLAAFKPDSTVLKTIIGTVKDKDNGNPIPGVTVSTSDGKVKTSTGPDGRYSISLADKETTLKFSYIGYTTAVIELKENKEVNVALAANNAALNEVVVVGFGTERKSAVTGSVSHATTMLTGKVAGLSPRKGERPTAIKTFERPVAEGLKIGDRRPGKDKPQSNLLTAGEWNDLKNWDFWKDLMNNQDWSAKQSHWAFYTANRVSVTLKSKSEQPLINYTVTALRNGTPLWKAQSNFEGKAELWPSLFNNEKEGLTIVVNAADGKELYKKDFAKNVRKLDITLNRQAESIKNLDVLFMVDATGSMGDEIDYLKSELEDIIGRLNNGSQIKTRTGLVFYRDKGDEYVVRDFGFDSNLMNVKNNLSKQYASGGGDFEEAVEEAMESAIYQQQWTTQGPAAKLMFMILDAPPHHDQARVKSIQRSVKEAAAKGITLIPVVASGIDKNTEFLMRFMAMGTNGTYVFLTDDSGIGNSHLKPTTGSYQVEQLNALLNRLIKKYAGLDSNVAGELLSSSDK